MIRATIAHEDKPIYGLSWSPEDSMVNPQYQLSIMTKFCHSRVKQIRIFAVGWRVMPRPACQQW